MLIIFLSTGNAQTAGEASKQTRSKHAEHHSKGGKKYHHKGFRLFHRHRHHHGNHHGDNGHKHYGINMAEKEGSSKKKVAAKSNNQLKF